jgi:PAS domain S-box-containing protein
LDGPRGARAGYAQEVPYFICPNCKKRYVDNDRRDGLTHQPVGCSNCGFGFLFELLEDYYPRPTAGFIVCDRGGRIIAVGRGVLELTGYRERELLGRELKAGLGLAAANGEDPAAVVLEWGVRKLDQPLTMRTRSGATAPITADFFPAYDDDGGLLVALAPRR